MGSTVTCNCDRLCKNWVTALSMSSGWIFGGGLEELDTDSTVKRDCARLLRNLVAVPSVSSDMLRPFANMSVLFALVERNDEPKRKERAAKAVSKEGDDIADYTQTWRDRHAWFSIHLLSQDCACE